MKWSMCSDNGARRPRALRLTFIFCYTPHHAPVAQLDRALPSGGRGQGFESLRARHLRCPTLAIPGPQAKPEARAASAKLRFANIGRLTPSGAPISNVSRPPHQSTIRKSVSAAGASRTRSVRNRYASVWVTRAKSAGAVDGTGFFGGFRAAADVNDRQEVGRNSLACTKKERDAPGWPAVDHLLRDRHKGRVSRGNTASSPNERCTNGGTRLRCASNPRAYAAPSRHRRVLSLTSHGTRGG